MGNEIAKSERLDGDELRYSEAAGFEEAPPQPRQPPPPRDAPPHERSQRAPSGRAPNLQPFRSTRAPPPPPEKAREEQPPPPPPDEIVVLGREGESSRRGREFQAQVSKEAAGTRKRGAEDLLQLMTRLPQTAQVAASMQASSHMPPNHMAASGQPPLPPGVAAPPVPAGWAPAPRRGGLSSSGGGLPSSGGGLSSSGGGLSRALQKRQEYVASDPGLQDCICALHGEIRPLNQLVPAPDGSGQMICSAASPCQIATEPALKKAKKIDPALDKELKKAKFPNGQFAGEGDWICPACRDLNYKRNTVCRKCGVPQAGDEMASVQVVGLPKDFTEKKVREIFGRYAVIRTCHMQKDDVDSVSAVMGMKNPEAAKWLIDNINNNIPMGMEVPVRIIQKPLGVLNESMEMPSDKYAPGKSALCSVHGKPRDLTALIPVKGEPGKLRCIEGNECRGLGGRKMCVFWLNGACKRGALCTFAHGENDNREVKKMHKCAFFEATGGCKNGERCPFVHGEEGMQKQKEIQAQMLASQKMQDYQSRQVEQQRIQQLEFEKQQMQQKQQEHAQRMADMEQRMLAMQQMMEEMGDGDGE